MKNLGLLLLVSIIISSCNDQQVAPKPVPTPSLEYSKYAKLDDSVVQNWNQKLNQIPQNSFEDILKFYVGECAGEGYGSYAIKEEKLSPTEASIEFTQVGLPDDAVAGRKIFLVLNLVNDQWKIASIYESYQCAKTRGHTDWDKVNCN